MSRWGIWGGPDEEEALTPVNVEEYDARRSHIGR